MATSPTVALPPVAVCIPTFNQAQFLEAAVASALQQDYGGEVSVFVSDDASDDATPGLLRDLASRHPSVTYVRQATNQGIAGNATAALRGGDADFVVRLDSDDILEPSYLSTLMPLMLAAPAAGYGHTAVREIDEHGTVGRTRRLARSTGLQSSEMALRASLRGYRTAANVLLFRRAALEHVNVYEGRPDFVEDYDLAVRLAAVGYGNVYVDAPLARYRIWSDTSGVRPRRKQMQLDGFTRIFAESIEPAWRSRGWRMAMVRRRRARLAAEHVPSCFGRQYSANERRILVASVLRLSSAPRVRVRVSLCRLGAAGVLERADALRYRGRDLVKAILKSAPMRPSSGH